MIIGFRVIVDSHAICKSAPKEKTGFSFTVIDWLALFEHPFASIYVYVMLVVPKFEFVFLRYFEHYNFYGNSLAIYV